MNPSLDVRRSSFSIQPSSFSAAMAVFYAAATVALFARFFWLSPLSLISLLTIGLTAFCYFEARRDAFRGVLVVSFLTPLVGSLPHLAPERCPPPLFALVAGFALGRLMARRNENATNPDAEPSCTVGVLFLLFAASGVLTAWRYFSYFPLGERPMLNATINLRQESVADALGAAWQTLVVMLSGPLVFLLAQNAGRDPQSLARWARAAVLGMFLACAVGLMQILFFRSFGNPPYWVAHNRINATFFDPNGLGAYVALVFPLLAAMAIGGGRRQDKVLAALTLLVSLVMLAKSGSRTGAAGVVVAAAMFPLVLALRFRIEGETFRQRVVFATLALLVVVVSFAPLEIRSEGKRWVLLDRLARTRDVIARQGLLAPIVRDRWPLWKPTIHVAFRYPIGGIGLGSFRYEMENIARLDGQAWRWLDNANNTYIQLASEVGMIGLAIVVIALVAVARAMLRVIRSPNLTPDERLLYTALGTAWFSFLLLLTTAMWLLFEQIQVMFWLFAAAFAWHRDYAQAIAGKPRRWLIPLGIASIAAVGASQMVHGFGSLSLAHYRAALGLEKSEGFHNWEMDETGRRFRWTREEARVTLPTTKGEIRIELLARNPDLAARPLALWVSVGGKTALRTEITSANWRWLRVPVPPNVPNPAELQIRVERTWRPSEFGLSGDKRALGVAVSRIENADPSEPLPP